MYKTFGFVNDAIFGRLARVEFSIPLRGERYAYLLGSFNAFNEGSFRMVRRGNRWAAGVLLPEGVWRYAFSLNGEFSPDPENPERETYRRVSYKFERTVSVARILGSERLYHSPSLLYLYHFGGRVHVILRAAKGHLNSAVLLFGDEEIPMRKKAGDELFDYFKAVVLGIGGALEYSFIGEGGNGTEKLGPFRGVPRKLKAPTWLLESVFYQVMPDRFARSLENIPGSMVESDFHGGDLAGLRERLNHLESLGINALYLTPIFESMTYHGYDIVDYFRVAKRLGGDESFENLVRDLKVKGMKLVLDGVFHHTSFFHPYFRDVMEKGERSEYRDFYRLTGFPVVSKEFLEILNSDLEWNEKYERLKETDWNYESFFSVWFMPRLNHGNPKVKEFITRVMRYWLDRGANGWRLDVAHGIPPELWREVRKEMPDEAYLLGEVMDDGRLWLFDKFHGVMNYALYDVLQRFFALGEITAEEFLNELELLSVRYGPAEYYVYNFLDNHDTERFLDLVGGDEDLYLCALAFLMTYKGIPAIFYGDEIGLRGSGTDMSAGRTPMIWDSTRWNSKIFEITKRLIYLRRSSRALQVGHFLPILFEGRVLAYERVLREERIIVGINCSKRALRITLPDGSELNVPPVSFRILRERFSSGRSSARYIYH